MTETATFEKETVDVLELLTLRVNDLSEQNAALLQRVNAQSDLVKDIDGRFGADSTVITELESAHYELYLQDCRIAELQQSIEDLMAGGVATTHQPEIRVRIGHTHTLKDGWRCDSTTVEWTGRGEVDWGSIRDELKNSHIAGDEEAKARHNEAIAPT